APGLAGLQAVEAAAEVGVEPPLDGAGGDAEVGGDVLMLAAPVGQPDDLQAVGGLAVGGPPGGPFEASGLVVGRLDADHGRAMSDSDGSEGLDRDRRPDSACTAACTRLVQARAIRGNR